jgi:hypothetical protein
MDKNMRSIPKTKIIIIEEDNEPETIPETIPFLEPFKKNEYIPNHIIENVLFHFMPTTEILHKYSDLHFIIKIKIRDLLNAPITNWKFNRPADNVRCDDIARCQYLNKSPVDSMLYLCFNNKIRSFDIIDGIHRYTALTIIKQKNSESLDLVTPGDFGNNNDATWLYESFVILNMRFNATTSQLIPLFYNLNKCIPIPELYVAKEDDPKDDTKEEEKEKKEIVERIARHWSIKYKSHFSPSNNPQKPHINRDRFIDLLVKIYDKHNLNETNKEKLVEIIERLNLKSSENPPVRKLSDKVIAKCKETGCWLFVYPEHIILSWA